MIRLVNAELFKLRTTRSFYGLTGGALGFVALFVILGTALDDGDASVSEVMVLALVAQLIGMVLGILAVTSEFRHGTITPSLAVAPWRSRLMLAKLGAIVIVSLALGLLAAGIIALVVSAGGGDMDRAPDVIAGAALVTALYAALGVGLGALVRNQVGAIIGGLIYVLALESLLGLIPGLDEILPKYGITGAANALAATGNGTGTDTLAQLPGGLLLAAYAAVFLVVGLVVMQRRDVTA